MTIDLAKSLWVRAAGRLVLAIFALVPAQGLISVLASTQTPWPLVFKSWKEILMIVAGLALLVGILRSRRWLVLREFFARPIVAAILFYCLLHVLLLAYQPQGTLNALAGLVIDLRYIVFFLLVWLLATVTREWLRRAFVASATSLVVVTGFGILQQYVLPHDVLKYAGYSKETITPYLTVDKNYSFIRINSLLRGPNPLGAYVGMGLTALAAFGAHAWRVLTTKKKTTTVLFALALGSVLYASYSRSAQLAAAIGLVVALLMVVSARQRKWLLIVGAVLTLIAGGAYYALRDQAFVQTIIEHRDPNDTVGNDSNVGHAASLSDGYSRMLAQPLGGGIGSTGSASLLGDQPLIIENQYLYIAHESGWLGLGLFVVIQGMILRELYRRRAHWQAVALFASGIGFVAVGLLLPVFADDTIAYVWWGLAGAALALPVQNTQNKLSYKKPR